MTKKNEVIETGNVLMIGDTFRLNIPGSEWLTVTGFRAYRNAKHPRLECGGLTRVADVVSSKGKRFGITVRPDDSLVYIED